MQHPSHTRLILLVVLVLRRIWSDKSLLYFLRGITLLNQSKWWRVLLLNLFRLLVKNLTGPVVECLETWRRRSEPLVWLLHGYFLTVVLRIGSQVPWFPVGDFPDISPDKMVISDVAIKGYLFIGIAGSMSNTTRINQEKGNKPSILQ